MRIQALLTGAALSLTSITSSQAETAVKVAFLYDFSGLYADVGGPGGAVAARMAAEISAPERCQGRSCLGGPPE